MNSISSEATKTIFARQRPRSEVNSAQYRTSMRNHISLKISPVMFNTPGHCCVINGGAGKKREKLTTVSQKVVK